MKEPAVFIIDYNDGLKAAAFLMTGMVEDFTVAVDVDGRSTPVSTLMNLQNSRPHHHFGCLVKNIEKMFQTEASCILSSARFSQVEFWTLRLNRAFRDTKSWTRRSWPRYVIKRLMLPTSAPLVGDPDGKRLD